MDSSWLSVSSFVILYNQYLYVYCSTIMAVPIIDGIDSETFRYSPVYAAGQNFRGIFEWGFLYKESSVPNSVLNTRKYNSEPYKWVSSCAVILITCIASGRSFS